MASVYPTLIELVQEGRAASLATVVAARPEEGLPAPGTKLLVPEVGEGQKPDTAKPQGSIHPELDDSIVEHAVRFMQQERSETVTFQLSNGEIEVFIQSFPPAQHLIIVGGVHVSIPLSKLAKMLGYKVTVLDPRGMFATPTRFPEVDNLVVDWPEDALPALDLNTSTSVVVLTHDPKLDLPAIKIALDSSARYVGAIGSRSTAEQRREELAEMGATQEQLAHLHTPIGLKIGARTPAEIAVSIMAEVVAARRTAPTEAPSRP